jgi:phosphoribosylanthranilate isomerase
VQVKICGTTNVADAFVAAEAGADFIGLVLADSPRRVELSRAREIVHVLPANSQAIVVVRDMPINELLDAMQTLGVMRVQLHGREDLAYLQALTTEISAKGVAAVSVWKAWEVDRPDAAPALVAYVTAALAAGVALDAILLDVPKGAPHPGFDCLGRVCRQSHASLASLERAPALWCSGGLTPDNVSEAARGGIYAGVDVARGVEASPGVKNHDALRRFVQAAKSIGQAPPASSRDGEVKPTRGG